MKRFRFTLLAVCLVLLWLGGTDIAVFLRNRAPQSVSIADLERQGTPREWLRVTGGFLDLERAISTSGTVELQALLVPLQSSPEAASFSVLVETRDPQILALLQKYHFGFDSVFERDEFLARRKNDFHPQRDVTGMVVTGLVAAGNRDKLLKLARTVGMTVPDDVLFLSEGKEPPTLRGFFFAGVGLLGLLRLLAKWRERRPEPAGENDLTVPPQG
jgi:hypothetical protein